jgi:hypothetical protein
MSWLVLYQQLASPSTSAQCVCHDLCDVQAGLVVDLIPRRFFDWRNKPQRNRIVADFAGFNSEIRKVAIGA